MKPKKRVLIFLLFMLSFFKLFPGDQSIISFLDGETASSTHYVLENAALEDTVTAISLSSYDEALNFSSGAFESFAIENNDSDRYELSYSESAKNVVYFPIVPNTEKEIKNASFNLIEQKDGTTYETIIDETYYIPASVITLSDAGIIGRNIFVWPEDPLDSSSEETSLGFKHNILYKKQQAMIRISRGDKKYDIYTQTNQLKKQDVGSNTDDFLSGASDYVDFIFDYTSSTVPTSINSGGMEVKFANGYLEVSGVPKGDYKLYLYTFRYSNPDSADGTYLVTTLEDEVEFSDAGETQLMPSNNFDVLDVSTEGFPEIKVTVISTSLNQEISVINETLQDKFLDTGNTANVVSNSVTSNIPDTVYLEDGTTLTLDVDGSYSDGSNNYYFKKWFITYTTAFPDKDGLKREAILDLEATLSDSSTVSLTDASIETDRYYLSPNPVPLDTRYPHQTVAAYFDSVKIFSAGDYLLDDNVLVPGSRGHRDMKLIDYTGVGIDAIDQSIINSGYSDRVAFSFDNSDYKWGLGSEEIVNGLMLRKVTTDTKAELYDGMNGKKLEFYTDERIQNFTKEEENGDKVKFSWENGPLNSNNATMSYDKFLFRISKLDNTTLDTVNYSINGKTYSDTLPNHYFNLYNGENPVNLVDGANNPGATVGGFISGTSDYIDLVFESDTDTEITTSTAMFVFSSSNELSIIGLPRDDYYLQVYSIKTGHDGTYKILTYEDYDTPFTMDLPEVATGEFASQNNFFKIDYITAQDVTIDNESYIQTKVNFITKLEREVELTNTNLITASADGETAEANINLTARELVNANLGEFSVVKSEKLDFQFPLDIVFLIDNSGSMQNEIDDTKAGLNAFTNELISRGFDVKFNLITFGPEQNSSRVGTYWDSNIARRYDDDYLAIYKNEWFNDLAETIDAFDDLIAGSGYYGSEENSAWALHYGIEHLNNNGRYLDYANNIVSNSAYKDGYIPSKKWLILLTDENMDTDHIGDIPGAGYTRSNVLEELTENLKDSSITLTGIMHVNKNISESSQADYDLEFQEVEKTRWNWWTWSWETYTELTVLDDRIDPKLGVYPADTGDIYHTDLKLKSYGMGDLYNMYEMGGNGEYVEGALLESINNIGIIQRWVLTYTSPYPLFDGTTRQVDFLLKEVYGKDGNPISTAVKDLNSEIDRQYKVPEEKIRIEFLDPSETNLQLNKNSQGKWVIDARARAKYYQEIDGETVILEDKIKRAKINIVDSNTGKTLIIGDSDSEDVTLSKADGAWYSINLVLSDEEVQLLKDEGTDYIDIEIIASTTAFNRSETLKRVHVDVQPPKIDEIVFTNLTLQNLWDSMKTLGNSGLFTSSEVSAYSGYLLNDTNSSDLADQDSANGGVLSLPDGTEGKFAKEGDRLIVSITVSDDNIDETATLDIDLDDFGIGSATSISKTKISDTQIKFDWEITINTVSEGTAFAVFDVEDKYGNNLNERFEKAEMAQLDNTAIEDAGISSFTINGSSKYPYNNEIYRYLNDDYEIEYTDSNDARTHLVLFRHDGLQSDTGISNVGFQNTNFGGTPLYYGATQDSNDFEFENVSTGNYDGKYEIKRILAIDKAGNISETNGTGIVYGSSTSGEEEIGNILDANIASIGTNSSIEDGEYFVDTVAPRDVLGKVIKVSDADPSLNTLMGLPKELAFKENDRIKVTLEGNDYNLANAIHQSIARVGGVRINATVDMTLNDSASIPPNWETTEFIVENGVDTLSNHNFYDATVVDKAGNSTLYNIIATLSNETPASANIILYENFRGDWKNASTQIDGNDTLQADYGGNTYGFSKGSEYSDSTQPRFALNFVGDLSTVSYLRINLNGTDYLKAYTPSSSDISVAAVDNGRYLVPNSRNTIKVLPYSISGKPAISEDTAYIVADTGINSSTSTKLTRSANYMPATEKYEFDLNLSGVLELAGLKGYKVKTVKTKINGTTSSSSPTITYPFGDSSLGSDYDNHIGLITVPSAILTGANIDRTVGISRDDLVPGSRVVLIVSVIDNLGSQDDLEFSFLLSEPTVKIKATTNDSNRVRESNVELVGETGSNTGFEVEALEETGE